MRMNTCTAWTHGVFVHAVMANATPLAAGFTVEALFRCPSYVPKVDQRAALVYQRMVDAVETLEQSEQLYRYPELVLMTAEHLAGVTKHWVNSTGSILLQAMRQYNLVPQTSYLFPYPGPSFILSARELHDYIAQLPRGIEIAPGVSAQMYGEKVYVWYAKCLLCTDFTL